MTTTKTAGARPKAKKKSTAPSYADYDHVSSAGEAALYYGFTPLKRPHLLAEDTTKAKHISEGEVVVDSDNHEAGAVVRLEEKVALMRTYEEADMSSLPQPLMFYYEKPFVGDRKKTKEFHCGLEMIGAPKSVAEAILIQTSLAILHDAGLKDLHVDINSIGDKESLARFTREITAFYRKHINDLTSDERQLMKKDIFSLLGSKHGKCPELAAECPKSINFLSEKSRQHFKEVLEYLETLGIPYTINNTLVANRDYCSETIFEIRDENKDSHPLAIGIRYDTLAKRLGHKKDLAAIGASIAFTPPKKAFLRRSLVEKILNPKACFMQLGFEAKLKSLAVIEALRKAKMPVAQSLAKDKMAGQIGLAEKVNADIVLIMGKKEAMENSVIVRDGATRSQDTVLLADLPAYIKAKRS